MMRDSVAVSGGAGGIVLAGAAGVGKSRLAREIVGHAHRTRRPCHWLYATASARSVPLGVFAAFASSFGADPLRRVHEVIAALTDPHPGPATLVGVDDAHLLDEQSALVVHQLVQRRAATVVLTVRSGATAPDAISSLYKDHAIPRLELQPLSATDVETLLEQALGGPMESASMQRLWRYTRGNALYLRQLLSDELARGTLTQRSGIWVWAGHPEVSPTLINLIESNVGRHDTSVLDVIDTVAIAEPIELTVLQSVTESAAIEEAEAGGIVVVDTAAGLVRLAHPLYGEARRRRLGALARSALGRNVSDAIAALCAPTPQQLVRRAVLTAGANGGEDFELLALATQAALHLLDLNLAVDFAERARKSRTVASELLYGFTLMVAGRAEEGEQVLGTLDDEVDRHSTEFAMMGLFRAANLAWSLGRLTAAEAVLDNSESAAAGIGLTSSYRALRSSILSIRGQVRAAADSATACIQAPDLHPTAAMFCTWGLTAALGELGEVDRLHEAAARGYSLANAEPEASHLRFGVGVQHVEGLLAAGCVTDACEVAARLHAQAQDMPASLALTTLLLGMSEMGRGNLGVAQRWFREALATYEYVTPVTELAALWLATALAMTGDAASARRHIAGTPDRFRAEVALREPLRRLADAWTEASAGQISAAIGTATAAAQTLRKEGRPAPEVWCLQTATQFGDSSGADRLAELAHTVEGPRAGAAAAHAAALANNDGAGLLSASRRYESFGDRIAAADAAAHAAVAFRRAGSRGSALTANSVATRLADQCRAATPALRTANTRAVLTPRQREIVSLVAAGHTNRVIASRLQMSVRSVEGHLFRASQRNGVNTREALAQLLGSRMPAEERMG